MSGAPDATDGFEVAPVHDGQPMHYKGTRYSWEGDFEVIVRRFACDCGLTCEVSTRELDGGPEMVRRRRATS